MVDGSEVTFHSGFEAFVKE